MEQTPPHINRVHFQGEATSSPSIKSISERTKVTSFQLSMKEGWINGAGKHCERKNRITIEVVGRDAERISREVKMGSFVTLEGYMRSENLKGQVMTKVRTLSIDVW